MRSKQFLERLNEEQSIFAELVTRLMDGCQSFSNVSLGEFSVFCIGWYVMTLLHQFQDATICRCTAQAIVHHYL